MEDLNKKFDQKTVEQIALEMEQAESKARTLRNQEKPSFEPVDLGKSEIFYLDDNNNFVDEEAATKSVIQVYDNDGNLAQEVWSTKSVNNQEKMPADQQIVTVYVDEEGNEVAQEVASFIVLKKYVKDELVSEEKYPLSNKKNGPIL